MPATTDLSTRATELLHELAGPDAVFREHQLEAIADLVEDRARVLCVQRTGWGKSAVYFVATALLRERGAGPTLIVSPLLALMRNQIAAAERLGLRAHTIKSTNRDEGDAVRALLAGVPVLGTTATANDRVVADVAEQLAAGEAVRTYRGRLARSSLRLEVVELP